MLSPLVTRRTRKSTSATVDSPSKQTFDNVFDEIFASTFSPPTEGSQDDCYLSADTEASLFCNLSDLRDMQNKSDDPAVTAKMLALLDIESIGADGRTDLSSYKGPIGSHPSTCLYEQKSGDTDLDEPFDEWEGALGDVWIEAAMAEANIPPASTAGEDGELIYARDVKYHRDRDFLNKYGWRRIINATTSKVVYQHEEGRWPEQPSVKAARRAMRAFFDERREERRNPEAGKRRRGATEKAEEKGATEMIKSCAMAPEIAECVTVKPPPPPLVPATADADASGNGKRAKPIEYNPPLLAPIATPSELRQPATKLEVTIEPNEAELENINWDSMDKQERRKHKNRQAAATSRKRQMDQKKMLEDENATLRQENAYLRKMMTDHMRIHESERNTNGTGTTLGDAIEMSATLDVPHAITKKPLSQLVI